MFDQDDETTAKLDAVWNASIMANATFKFTDRGYFAEVLKPLLERYSVEIVQTAALTMARSWERSIPPNPNSVLAYIRVAESRQMLDDPEPEQPPAQLSVEAAYERISEARRALGMRVPELEEFAAKFVVREAKS
jgi:hypothetical protein